MDEDVGLCNNFSPPHIHSWASARATGFLGPFSLVQPLGTLSMAIQGTQGL